MNSLLRFSIVIATLFTFSSAHAIQLIPTSLSIFGKGKGSTGRFEIVNDTNEPIAIEVNVTKRIVDKYGKEKHPPVNELFNVHPSNLIIKAGEKKSFRIALKSPRSVKVEESYRVIVEQLPIDISKGPKVKKGNIKILMKFLAALYVSPRNGKAQIKMTGHKVKNDNLLVELKNTGNSHQILEKFHFMVKGKKSTKLMPKDLPMISGENILANTSRIFQFPIPKNVKNSKYEIKFALE